MRNRVRRAQVEDCVAGRARLGRENPVLILDERRLRLYVESLVAPVHAEATAHGRDARERRARVLQLGVDVVEAEGEPERVVRRDFEAHLRALEAAVGLVVARLDKVLAYRAGGREEDEVLDVVQVEVRLALHALRRVAQREVDAVVDFGREQRVAYLERKVPGVRAVVVKLFERGRAVGVRVVRDERALLPERDAHASRAREARERAVDQAFGRVAVVLDAAAELELEALEVNLLKSEGRD